MLNRVLILLAALLVVKVTFSVALGYHDYFPPDFNSDFLRGRESYFFGGYQLAFYSHIVAGPTSLVLGLILVSQSFRARFPNWHRRLGKVEIALILFLLVPSGLWMACYAQTGMVAGAGFFGLALATGLCAAFGWRSAVRRRFADHRRWVWRCFLLLSSAVIVRLIGGLATVTWVGVDWSYPLAAWASWLVPLAIYEISRARPRATNSQARVANRFIRFHREPLCRRPRWRLALDVELATYRHLEKQRAHRQRPP